MGQWKLFASDIGLATALDLMQLFEQVPPDVLVCDNTDYGGWAAGRKAGLPTVFFGTVGQLPAVACQTTVGKELRLLLHELSAPADPELVSLTGDLFIDPTPAGFASSPPEGNLRRVRPAVPDLGVTPALTEWLAADSAPLIYVTLGTVFNRTEGLMELLLTAVADLPVRVLAALGPNIGLGGLHTHRNLFVQSFVPQATAIAHSSAVVCHGGRGTVYAALAAGVPLCLLPVSADQPVVAKRCAEIGVGIVCSTGDVDVGSDTAPTLDPSLLKPATLRQAVQSLLEDVSYRERAGRLKVEIAGLPPTERAAVWIESLIDRPSPG